MGVSRSFEYDADKLVDRLFDPGYYKQALRRLVDEFAEVCESPIEVMLGVALHSANVLLPAGARRMFIFLGKRDRPHLAQFHGQIEICPQYQWGSYRIDFAIFTSLISHPVFVECDGHDFHERTKEQATRDREKDRAIQTAGIPVLRFTGSEIWASPSDCAAKIFHFMKSRLSDDKAPA